MSKSFIADVYSMLSLCLALVCVAGGDDASTDYWRIRTRAKLAINRSLQGPPTAEGNPWFPPVPEKPKVAQLPEMTFYTYDTCAPCGPVKDDDKAGKFKGHFTLKHFDVTKQDAPPEITTVPAMQWKGSDGRTWTYPDPGYPENDPRRGYVGAEKLIAMWKETQKPKKRGVP